MAGLWNGGRGADYTTTAFGVVCLACGAPALKRFAKTATPLCAECYSNVSRARRQLEREGTLPKHGRDLTGVYGDPLVLERCRELKWSAA